MRPLIAATLAVAALSCSSSPGPATLTVTATGPGKVTSFPAGIDCGTTCTHGFHVGDSIALLATPNAGSALTSWSVAGCSGLQCGVKLTGNTTVTAVFGAAPTATVTVTVTGPGKVISAPAGIDCGTTCSHAFNVGDQVVLSATPAAGVTWSVAGCSGAQCGFTVTGDTQVTATFATATLTVTTVGPGRVGSLPSGIDCGSTCAKAFPLGSQVTLSALPDSGAGTFKGWSVSGCTTDVCTVTLSADTAVTATFAAPSRVTVKLAGLGTGTVTGPGIYCYAGSAVCETTVPDGTSVQLHATASEDYTFVGWRGGGCSGTGDCTVTATGYVPVTAGFAAVSFWRYAPVAGVFSTSLHGAGLKQFLAPGNPEVKPQYVFGSSSDAMVHAFDLGTTPSAGSAVWLIDLWADEARPLAYYPSAGFPPPVTAGAVSPDGKSVAYLTMATANNVATIKADGTGLTAITNYTTAVFDTNDCHFASCATTRFIVWSPDGTRVAWVSTAPSPPEDATIYQNVWIAQADGSTPPVRLTNFDSVSIAGDPGVFGVDWSPDGSKIAFVSSQDPGADRTGAATAPTVTNVWTVDVASKARFCVTNFTTEYSVDMATWAKSGSTLVFGSLEDPALTATPAGTARNLFTAAADGTGLRALTHATGNGALNAGPWWHADGKTLLFESNVDPTDITKTASGMGIWQVTLDAAAVAQPVTFTTGVYDWSPLEDND